MQGFERSFVLYVLLYMMVYFPFFFAVPHLLPSEHVFTVIAPFHFLGMVQNLIALIITIRDLFMRNFSRENQKLIWLLIILFTGGIGWIVYIFKHALKPRHPVNAH